MQQARSWTVDQLAIVLGSYGQPRAAVAARLGPERTAGGLTLMCAALHAYHRDLAGRFAQRMVAQMLPRGLLEYVTARRGSLCCPTCGVTF